MARFSLLPRDEKFYADFATMAEQLQRGARLLEEMLASDPPDYEKAQQIKDVEHRCDFLTHEIIQRLNRTFVTPIDREDIHLLARALDDVLDAVDSVAALLPLYKIERVRFGARELATIITAQTDQISFAIADLEIRKSILDRAQGIGSLEHEGDQIHQQAIGQLFDQERDPLMVIKWKEIFDFLETATDRCEDVANVLENVVVKHG